MITLLSRTVTGAVIATVIVAGAAACGRADHDTSTLSSGAQQWSPSVGAEPHPLPVPPLAVTLPPAEADVDHSNPDAVTQAALRIWYSWDPTHDHGPNDAAARSAPLLTAQFLQQLTATSPIRSPGAQWERWAAVHAVVTPQLVRSAEPTQPDTTNRAHRSYTVELTATTPDGGAAGTDVAYVDITLEHNTHGWQVDSVKPR